jgi:hypothetical protein
MTTTYSGTPTSPESLVELKIIGTLCARLAKAGWSPTSIDTGDETENHGWVTVTTPKAVKTEFASVGQATVVFTNGSGGAGQTQRVFLVGGNGVDVISDWSYTDGDANGFDAAMTAIIDYVAEAYDR